MLFTVRCGNRPTANISTNSSICTAANGNTDFKENLSVPVSAGEIWSVSDGASADLSVNVCACVSVNTNISGRGR